MSITQQEETIEPSFLWRLSGFAFGVGLCALIVFLKRDDARLGIVDLLAGATNPVAGLAGLGLGLYLFVSMMGVLFAGLMDTLGVFFAYRSRKLK